MSKVIQDISNAREEMQRQIMEELAQTGECFLCQETMERMAAKYPKVATLPIYKGKHLFIKHNDFPYEGAKLHMLIVPTRHVSSIEDLTQEEFIEFKSMYEWINKTFCIKGASAFTRYGDMSFTGATLSHLHTHVLHGVAKYDGCESIKAKLSYK